ncbi:hypothetical protein [Acidiphilium sp.]|uniref:hypothetical protein n=1 Tax=Acidiphilium sp. TaxID=527 RepID=UPI0025880B9B|nr:hypothetical protein [Acidiphilium sp.]
MSAAPEILHKNAPSQPSGAEPERYRFFSIKLHRLISYREDGAVYVRDVCSDWVRTRAPADTDAIKAERFERAALAITNLPAWARSITDLPTMTEIERWSTDSVVEATDGEEVEPDGHSPDGAPSWLLALGMI